MRLAFISAFALFAAVTIAAHRSPDARGALSDVEGQHAQEAHQHPEAAALKNPVAADAASIEAGKTLYSEQCVDCHGEAGKGDGPMAAYTGEPLPSDLSDAQWKHGSTDGEIYTVIHDGVDATGMKNFDKDLTPEQIWSLVNYVRTLGPKPAPAH